MEATTLSCTLSVPAVGAFTVKNVVVFVQRNLAVMAVYQQYIGGAYMKRSIRENIHMMILILLIPCSWCYSVSHSSIAMGLLDSRPSRALLSYSARLQVLASKAQPM